MYEINGHVAGSNLTTKAHVRVSSQVVAGNNISKQWTGSQLPAAIVSNTGGDDSANTLNDLTVSRANTDVKNRWTTWQTGTDDDWASILFGNSGDLTKRFVDNLSVDFLHRWCNRTSKRICHRILCWSRNSRSAN